MGTELVLAMELFTSASIQRIQGRAGELYLGARLYCGPIPSPPPLSIFNPDEWPGMEGTRDLMKMKRPKGAKLKKGYSLSESGWNELQSSALYGR